MGEIDKIDQMAKIGEIDKVDSIDSIDYIDKMAKIDKYGENRVNRGIGQQGNGEIWKSREYRENGQTRDTKRESGNGGKR